MTEQRTWKVGGTTVRFEPPNLVWTDTRGRATLEDAVGLLNIYRELGQRQPILIVANLSQATILDREGGRYLSEHTRPEWILGCIYIGARLLHRAISKGIALASYMTGRSDESALSKVHFVASEAQARELILRLYAPSPLAKAS